MRRQWCSAPRTVYVDSMKTAFSVSTFCLWLMACVVLVLWLTGCASMRADWGARVGHYTYDQAVTDMGPPDKQAKLTDGTLVAEWLVTTATPTLTAIQVLMGPSIPVT